VILGGRSRDTDVAPLAGEFEVMNLAKPPTAKKIGKKKIEISWYNTLYFKTICYCNSKVLILTSILLVYNSKLTLFLLLDDYVYVIE
jgi:hypothetical protein